MKDEFTKLYNFMTPKTKSKQVIITAKRQQFKRFIDDFERNIETPSVVYVNPEDDFLTDERVEVVTSKMCPKGHVKIAVKDKIDVLFPPQLGETLGMPQV